MRQTFKTIGIMTGNSLDAVDLVLTEFKYRQIRDLCTYSLPIPQNIADHFRNLKQMLADNNGDIQTIARNYETFFNNLHDEYIRLIAFAVRRLLEKAGIAASAVTAIGFHGQTCAHLPPSISEDGNTYTLQIGSGQMLADLTGIPVAFDFRSDDLMNGGEAAPLAPVHNRHIAQDLTKRRLLPLAFCNGGNTGNLTIITKDKTFGWDCGPFNHFVDYLARSEYNQPCDFDGQFGAEGQINYDLLRDLFEHAVCTQNGKNFLLQPPPKSADPAWYKTIPALTSPEISAVDRIRTCEFFSVYIMVYSLRWLLPYEIKPSHFLIFGGGWKNPLILNDFKKLLSGQTEVLPEHRDIFNELKNEIPEIAWSDKYGYSGQFMEARIFADMAKCLLTNEPFSFPEITGCQSPTIGGILVKPGENNPLRWSRAAKGWK